MTAEPHLGALDGQSAATAPLDGVEDSPALAAITARVDALDGLRGCLALVVVFGHVLPLLFPAIDGGGTRHFRFDHLLDKSPFALLLSGDFAVRIFFVHSGFVLALKYFRSGDRRWPIAMFVRRPLRLGLPVVAAVLSAFVMVRLVGMRPALLAHVTGGTASEQFPLHPSFGTALSDAFGGTMLLSHHNLPGAWWTMPVELWCSLALLATLIAWSSLSTVVRRAVLVAYGIGLLALVATTPDAPPLYFVSVGGALSLLLLLSISFAIGAGLAKLWATDPGVIASVTHRFRWSPAVLGLGGLAVGVFPSAVKPFTLGNDSLLQLLIMVAAGLVVAVVLGSRRLKELFQSRFPAWLGRISFAVYLVHLAVQRTLMARAFIWMRQTHGLPYNAAAVVAIVGQLVIVLALAHLLSITVDRAAMTWGKREVYARLGIGSRRAA